MWVIISPILISMLVFVLVMQIAENIMLCFTEEDEEDDILVQKVRDPVNRRRPKRKSLPEMHR